MTQQSSHNHRILILRLILDKRKNGENKDGFPVSVFITHKGKNKYIRTGYRSKLKDWSEKSDTPKRSHPDYYSLSDAIAIYENKISKIKLEMVTESLTMDQVAQRIKRKDRFTFYEAAMDVVEWRSTQWSAVKSFDSVYPSINIDEITHKLVEDYIEGVIEKGHKPGGVDSYVRSLRAVWNKLGKPNNPFTGHSIKKPPQIKTVASAKDLRTLWGAQLSYSGRVGGPGLYRDYFLLQFLLGGIDTEVLARLNRDNVKDGRIHFNRDKGGSDMACNNIVPERAWQIIDRIGEYKESGYFVPIHRAGNYPNFRSNYSRRFKELTKRLELSVALHPKAARYTFIHRAQELLIDERITAQIVGHKRKTTTSLYTNDFPLVVQDQAHLKIIDF